MKKGEKIFRELILESKKLSLLLEDVIEPSLDSLNRLADILSAVGGQKRESSLGFVSRIVIQEKQTILKRKKNEELRFQENKKKLIKEKKALMQQKPVNTALVQSLDDQIRDLDEKIKETVADMARIRNTIFSISLQNLLFKKVFEAVENYAATGVLSVSNTNNQPVVKGSPAGQGSPAGHGPHAGQSPPNPLQRASVVGKVKKLFVNVLNYLDTFLLTHIQTVFTRSKNVPMPEGIVLEKKLKNKGNNPKNQKNFFVVLSRHEIEDLRVQLMERFKLYLEAHIRFLKSYNLSDTELEDIEQEYDRLLGLGDKYIKSIFKDISVPLIKGYVFQNTSKNARTFNTRSMMNVFLQFAYTEFLSRLYTKCIQPMAKHITLFTQNQVVELYKIGTSLPLDTLEKLASGSVNWNTVDKSNMPQNIVQSIDNVINKHNFAGTSQEQDLFFCLTQMHYYKNSYQKDHDDYVINSLGGPQSATNNTNSNTNATTNTPQQLHPVPSQQASGTAPSTNQQQTTTP